MSTLEIAQRCDARRTGRNHWQGHCPSHEDRSPSLSIGEGRDGRTIIYCHAGCSADAIVAALGLGLHNLFAAEGSSTARRATHVRPAQAADVERALQTVLKQILTEESERTGFPQVAELTRHRNEARRIVERRYQVRLRRERTSWWQVEPHAADPAWSACIDQAVTVIAARANIAPDWVRAYIPHLTKLQARALHLARQTARGVA